MQCFPGASEGALTWVGLEKQPQSGLQPGDGKIQKLVFCTPPPSHLTHTSTARSSPQPPSSLRVGRRQQEWGGLENRVSLPSSACRGTLGAPSCVTMWPKHCLLWRQDGDPSSSLHQNFQLPALDKENNETLQRVETRVTSCETDSPSLGQSPAPGKFPEP